MNTDHYINHGEYIILHRDEEGNYMPVTFSDGSLVIYGDVNEALHDAGKTGLVTEVIIPKN